MRQRQKLLFIRNLSLAIGLTFLFSCSPGTGKKKKVIILAFDGMDARIVREMFSAGKLPNFKKVAGLGGFKNLWSSIPPQSPVAWSNFITGKNPGGHGIFDFIHRDPENYTPFLSMTKTLPPEKTLKLGKYILPVSKAKINLERRGKAFWEYLEEAGIPAVIFKIPSNYPPVRSGKGVSGMGTPDLMGSYGIYQYFTTDPADIPEDYGGALMKVVSREGEVIRDQIVGPINTFLQETPEMTIPFTVRIDPDNAVERIDLPNQKIILKEGEWSDWVVFSFKPVPFAPATTGIGRFYAQQIHPHFKLYLTPLNINPKDPALPMDWPSGYARQIADHVGYFYTQGMPEDTKALTNGTFSTEDFYVQSQMVLKERNRLFDYLFSQFKEGLFFFYYSSTDLVSHIFWHLHDKNHPIYDPVMRAKLGDVLEEIYEEVDKTVGKVLPRLDKDTTLIIMSDHGFAPFYNNFELNTWLFRNGYLALQGGDRTGSLYQNVDWSRTKAYSLGFNGLYINLKGREKYGIVSPGAEQDRLVRELKKKLEAVTDSKNGKSIIRRAHIREDIYSGPYTEQAPDLLVGYDWEYRISWKSALGDVTEDLITVSEEKWSGDHCGATELVPGILFSNKPLRLAGPHLYDLAPSILEEFGLRPRAEMIGHNIFRPAPPPKIEIPEGTEKRLKSLDYI